MNDPQPHWYGLGAPDVHLIVRGIPAPQGSKKAVGRAKSGRTILVESSKKVAPWRDDVRAAAKSLIEEIMREARMLAALIGDPDPVTWTPLDGPLRASMVFTATRPKSHYRTGRNAHLLRDGAPSHPASAPDLSKLLRSTEDALSSAGLWRDDARLVEYVRAAKVYVGNDPDALEVPGVTIRLWRVPQ